MEDNPKSYRQQPDITPESAGSRFSLLDGEDIIDLTDIVDPTELEGQTTNFQEAVEMVEDDIIELTDIVQAVKPGAQTIPLSHESGVADEDDIIELMDIVEPAQQDTQTTSAVHEAVETDEDDIIELTDLVQSVEPEAQAMTTFDSRAIDENDQEISGRLPDKDVYYETQNQRLDDTLSELEAMMDDTFSGEALDLGLEEAVHHKNTAAEDRDMEVPGEGTFADFPIGIALSGEQDEDETGEPSHEILTSLTAAQIDAAVERLIQAKFGQTIEQMVAASIEKIVTQEIESIRQALLEDEDAME